MPAPERPGTLGGNNGAPSPNRTLMLAAVAVVALVAVTMAGGLFVFAREHPLPRATPAPTLLGEAVAMGEAKHVGTAAELEIAPGQPPVGGPHYSFPAPPGILTAPADDGKAIHSLEHGMIWITYRPDLVSAKDLDVMTAVARAHPTDIILSPRPANASPASIVSWGQRLNLKTPVSGQSIEEFVATNVNKSPEPGVR